MSAIEVAAGKSTIVLNGFAETVSVLEGAVVSADSTGPAEVGLALAVHDISNVGPNRRKKHRDENFMAFISKYHLIAQKL